MTRFKYSLFAKGLCLILSALLFFSFAYFTATVIEGTKIYGFHEYMSNNIPDFFNSHGFESLLTNDLYHTKQVLLNNKSIIESAFETNKNKIIDTATDVYLREKATIIKNELEYAVENYDESYFDYEYTADAVDVPEPVTSESNIEPVTDKNGNIVPRNIEAAKKILENCEGIEFLDYEALVRESAFNENEFHYSYSLYINENRTMVISFSNINGYDMNENEIKKHFLAEYTEFKNNVTSDTETQHYQSVERLEKLSTLKYFITDKDGNIFTNSNNEISAEEFKVISSESSVSIQYDNEGFRQTGLSNHMSDFAAESLQAADNCKVYLYIDFDNAENNGDTYALLIRAYNKLLTSPATKNISFAAVSLVLSFILLITFLSLCGYKNSKNNVTTAVIDSLPTDIHFIISIGAVAGLTFLGIYVSSLLLESTAENYNELFYIYGPTVLAAYFTFSYMIFTEWLTSTVRIVKSGQKYFSRMLIAKGFSAMGRLFRKIYNSLRNFLFIFRYKPKKMQRAVILAFAGYFIINMLLTCGIFAVSHFTYGFVFFVFGLIALIAYNCVFILFVARYFINLDKIIDASSRHEFIDFGNEKLPESLRILVSNLTNTNEALDEAIQKAVRDEQMKTELITNVSHDLKTPLTSLISYSDLLEKCDITDETAQKYIGVIHTQSIKLKRLIEDLIEASKVSTGNITINATKLNLSELTMQVIAEFAPEMEKNGNEIRFSEPEIPPTVFADGSKTYRILANLLSNAKKYSAPDTRVYISVFTDNTNSFFEIKNVSAEPLNISPDELTERFVRGDKSRNKEGNGLGLSIAKDLCILQNGKLELCIDGDLFKARVTLPS